MTHWPSTQIALNASFARWWWRLEDEAKPDQGFIMAKSAGHYGAPNRSNRPFRNVSRFHFRGSPRPRFPNSGG